MKGKGETARKSVMRAKEQIKRNPNKWMKHMMRNVFLS